MVVVSSVFIILSGLHGNIVVPCVCTWRKPCVYTIDLRGTGGVEILCVLPNPT